MQVAVRTSISSRDTSLLRPAFYTCRLLLLIMIASVRLMKKTLLLTIGHDFYYIWWLLKEPFSFSFFFGNSFSRGSSFTLDDECFFSCFRIACSDFHRATRQYFKKSHHRCEQKIACVAATLGDLFIHIV